MRGSVVSDGREAIVSLKVIGAGSDRDSSNIEAAIDTGFTGHLTLPPETVRSLSLPERGFVEVELADGGMTSLSVYEARVLWHWRPVRVPVYEAEGRPLIGMSLLRGSALTIEVIPRGEVTIAERPRVAKTTS
jgi:clan AA aspartic protease